MHHHHRRHGLPEGDGGGDALRPSPDYLRRGEGESRPAFLDDVRDLFEGAEEYDFEGSPMTSPVTLNKGHGRLETRQCWVITDPDCLDYLPKPAGSGPTSTPWLRSRLGGRRQTGPRSTLATISAVWPGLPRLLVGGHPPTLGHRAKLALVFGCYHFGRSQPGT